MSTNKQKLDALKFAYQIICDKRNTGRYSEVFLTDRTGECIMSYSMMLDALNDIAKELKTDEKKNA